MTVLIRAAALAVTFGAVLSAGLVLVRSGSIRLALPVFLDMLLAAGLLRLAVHLGYAQALSAAVLLVVKRLVSAGIGTATAVRVRDRGRSG